MKTYSDTSAIMGYGSYAFRPLKLTKEQYNYLLPAIDGSRLESSQNRYYFHGNKQEHKDILNRLEGLEY